MEIQLGLKNESRPITIYGQTLCCTLKIVENDLVIRHSGEKEIKKYV